MQGPYGGCRVSGSDLDKFWVGGYNSCLFFKLIIRLFFFGLKGSFSLKPPEMEISCHKTNENNLNIFVIKSDQKCLKVLSRH